MMERHLSPHEPEHLVPVFVVGVVHLQHDSEDGFAELAQSLTAVQPRLDK